jgi:exodeoxyribonuclease III
MTHRLRIATWNINSVRARPHLLTQLVDSHNPDIICLQETKATDADFPRAAMEALGFPHIVLNGQRMHHGVAILSKVPLSDTTRQDWQANGEARHIGVRLPSGMRLENVYLPAGGDVPDVSANPKFGQKLAFLDRMTQWAGALTEPTILVGDLNIAPLPSDVWDHKALLDVVSHTPIECEKMAALQTAHGFIDMGRQFTPAPERLFTWWSYRAQDWRASDRGRRLDHIWMSPSIASTAKACTTVEAARGWDKPSDHAPIVIELAW